MITTLFTVHTLQYSIYENFFVEKAFPIQIWAFDTIIPMFYFGFCRQHTFYSAPAAKHSIHAHMDDDASYFDHKLNFKISTTKKEEE